MFIATVVGHKMVFDDCPDLGSCGIYDGSLPALDSFCVCTMSVLTPLSVEIPRVWQENLFDAAEGLKRKLTKTGI